jgi:hypothetical protein
MSACAYVSNDTRSGIYLDNVSFEGLYTLLCKHIDNNILFLLFVYET